MAEILLRSPYYEYLTLGASGATADSTIIRADSTEYTADNRFDDSSYAIIKLYIEGTLRYTITKDSDADYGVLIEISELCRDYLDITYDGTYTSQVLQITLLADFYDENDLLLGTVTKLHNGFDGYGDFMDGASPVVTPSSLLQSNTIMYIPEGTSGVVAEESEGTINYDTFDGNATGVNTGGQTITIVRVCEPKYTPIKITFVNKFGALQDLYFFKKSTESISTQKENYKRSLVTSTGTYDINTHARRTLNVQGTTSLSMNTGFVSEALNPVFEQLLLSEQIWATIDSQVIPIDIKTTQLTYKTSVNDKLINYTIDVEYAFNVINDLR